MSRWMRTVSRAMSSGRRICCGPSVCARAAMRNTRHDRARAHRARDRRRAPARSPRRGRRRAGIWHWGWCRCRDAARDATCAARPAAETAAGWPKSGSTPSRMRSARTPVVAPSIAALSASSAGGDVAEQPRAVLVDLELLVAAVEQREAQEALQRLDAAAERRRGKRQFLGGGLDRSGTGDLDEGFQGSQGGRRRISGARVPLGSICCDAQACRNCALDTRGDLIVNELRAAGGRSAGTACSGSARFGRAAALPFAKHPY